MIKKSYMKDLSICMVNYNAKDITAECLRAVYENSKELDYEIILVDNNSSDGSQASLAQEYPEVKMINNKENRGFARASNQAMAASSGRYLILLNNDTIVTKDSLAKMVMFMDANPTVGGVSSKLLECDGKTIIKTCREFPSVFGTLFSRTSLLTKLFPFNPWSAKNLQLKRDYNTTFEVDWSPFAAFMLRHTVIKQIGLLDEKYFIYWEDTDFCMRIRKAGWKIMYIPDAEIIHFCGQGGTRLKSIRHNAKMIFHMHYSAYKYFKKYYFKSIIDPVRWITFLGFITLSSTKIALMAIKTIYENLKINLFSAKIGK